MDAARSAGRRPAGAAPASASGARRESSTNWWSPKRTRARRRRARSCCSMPRIWRSDCAGRSARRSNEGRLVIAAPYVATAVAFGQAAGLDPVWLADLFRFRASRRREHHAIDPAPAKHIARATRVRRVRLAASREASRRHDQAAADGSAAASSAATARHRASYARSRSMKPASSEPSEIYGV